MKNKTGWRKVLSFKKEHYLLKHPLSDMYFKTVCGHVLSGGLISDNENMERCKRCESYFNKRVI